MDAQAYLIRHGWSGPGNPLNPNQVTARGGLGLTKPLLVARRSGNQGVGQQTTKNPTNQWWLRGFEDALKGVGQEGATVAGGGKPAPNALTSELYRFFVRGEVVPGTLGRKEKEGDVKEGRKRKRGGDGDKEEEDDGGKKMKKEKKESKEERRLRKEEKRRRKEEKAEKKKTKKEYKAEEDYPTPVSMDQDVMELDEKDQESGSLDTKELEKQRRKKEKKEKKREKDSKEEKKSKKRDASNSDDGSKSKSKSKSKKSKDEKRST